VGAVLRRGEGGGQVTHTINDVKRAIPFELVKNYTRVYYTNISTLKIYNEFSLARSYTNPYIKTSRSRHTK
jgi:hypothetical protein